MVCSLLYSDLDDDIATIQQIQRPMQESAANFFNQLALKVFLWRERVNLSLPYIFRIFCPYTENWSVVTDCNAVIQFCAEVLYIASTCTLL